MICPQSLLAVAWRLVRLRRSDLSLQACPSPECNKKVTEGGGGEQYFCEKCNQSFPNFKYRMILSVGAQLW